MKGKDLICFLNSKVDLYNQPSFIAADPISIPHSFSKKQDIEIAGLFAAIFAWGNRTTIINKAKELMLLMDNAPYDFCLHHSAADLKSLEHFKHRTFNTTDLLYFVEFLQMHYQKFNSLEDAFVQKKRPSDITIENYLVSFYEYFFSLDDVPDRTRKHVSTPAKKSSCKRLSMYLRWMVRNDNKGVDFGLWKKIKPSQLVCPLDLHVARVAKKMGLITRKQTDWETVLQLTHELRTLDPQDPAKYDFALFGLGVMEHY